MKIKKKSKSINLVPIERINGKIFLIRGRNVMIDSDLAQLYGVETKHLKRAVRRNIQRFPEDFMFKMTKEEYQEFLRYQFGTLERGAYSKYLPYVFTQEGVAMLSGVINSERAIQVNIQIMRAFIKMRDMLLERIDYDDLWRRLDMHEMKDSQQFEDVFNEMRLLDARVSDIESLDDPMKSLLKVPKKYKH